MASTLAAIKTDIRQVQVREFELPEIDDNGALMRVEAAGMCGAFAYVTREGTGRSAPGPGMNAHENAGVLVKVGKAFQARHGVEEGELVTLEEYLPCGHCEWCRIGEGMPALAGGRWQALCIASVVSTVCHYRSQPCAACPRAGRREVASACTAAPPAKTARA